MSGDYQQSRSITVSVVFYQYNKLVVIDSNFVQEWAQTYDIEPHKIHTKLQDADLFTVELWINYFFSCGDNSEVVFFRHQLELEF